MIHYVLFKFKPGISMDKVLRCYNDTYLKMKTQLSEVENISFRENCVSRGLQYGRYDYHKTTK